MNREYLNEFLNTRAYIEEKMCEVAKIYIGKEVLWICVIEFDETEFSCRYEEVDGPIDSVTINTKYLVDRNLKATLMIEKFLDNLTDEERLILKRKMFSDKPADKDINALVEAADRAVRKAENLSNERAKLPNRIKQIDGTKFIGGVLH